MTQIRRKPDNQYHTFLVEPDPDFTPTNWQDKPRQYRILSYRGSKLLKGSADAWRFLYNHQALAAGKTDVWAIHFN